MFSLKTILIVATAALAGIASAAPIVDVDAFANVPGLSEAGASDIHVRSPGLVAIDVAVDGLLNVDADIHVRSPDLDDVDAAADSKAGGRQLLRRST